MTTNFLSFSLGRFACLALRDGGRISTIHQEIVDAPPDQLDAAIQGMGLANEPVKIGYNALFVDTGSQRVLVDTGTGRGTLLSALAEAGIAPADVDRVVITHGDGDHIGGLLDEAGDPVFGNARYVLWREAYAQWSDPVHRSHMIEQFLALFRRRGVDEAQLNRMAESRAAYGVVTLPSLADRLELVGLEEEFLPGMWLVDGLGHRSDHVALWIDGGDEALLHVADAIRHPVQVRHPEWNGALDSFPEQCVQTRRRLLGLAARSNALLFAAHLPFPGLACIVEEGDGWVWQPY